MKTNFSSRLILVTVIFTLLTLGYLKLENRFSTHTLTKKINVALADFKENINIGIQVTDINTGKTLYEKNADRYFVPASNQKLFTAWTALNTLDPNFSFQTQLFVDTAKLKAGKLNDAIYFKFSGDPTLTFAELEQLVGALTKAGITHIAGNIIIDDTRFDQDPLSPGETWDDKNFCYGSPIHTLIVDHNCVTATLMPAVKAGEATVLTLPAEPQSMQFINQTITDFTANPLCKIEVEPADQTTYRVSGCIPSTEPPSKIEMAVIDPRANVLRLLNYLLQKNHIHYTGSFQFQKMTSATPLLATVSSPPLATLIAIMLKESDNTIADALFKTIGQQQSGQPGSWKNGSTAMHDVLVNTLGLDIPARTLIDGAGGSRYIYHTPQQIITLLRKAYVSPQAPVFIAGLAVAGVDGTLKDRLQEPDTRAHIQAKTGTMSGITALSGYMETRQQHKLVFSIMINGFIDSPDNYKKLEDTLCKIMLENA